MMKYTATDKMSRLALVLFFITAFHATPLSARTLGMVVDRSDGNPVVIFDADSDTVIGTVFVNPNTGLELSDAVIDPYQHKGYAARVPSQVWVIDLTTSPPSIASAPNPIPIVNPGTDMDLTTDGKYIIVSDGTTGVPPAFPAPLMSVIDLSLQAESSTFDTVTDNSAVDACDDNSVLVGSFNGQAVRRLLIDSAGILTDTGESQATSGLPLNVACSPGSTSGLAVSGSESSFIQSFTIPGLGLVDTRPLSNTSGQTVLINQAGDRAYVRSAGGAVDAFTYNSVTGALGAAPLFTIPITPFPLPPPDTGVEVLFGQDLMALHPNGSKLYVSEPSALNVYDANTGALLTSITDENIIVPGGMDIVTLINRPPVANAGADKDVECTSSSGANVMLDGTASSDPDGDPLTYTWTGPFGTVTGPTPTVALPFGTHSITLTVDDGQGGTSTDTVIITVADTTPPEILSISADPAILWPPNHMLVPVNIFTVATDSCSATVSCKIISVSSNESADGLGDGNTTQDWLITGDLQLELRSERSGISGDRVYTADVQCTDEFDNSSTDHVEITVKHDMRK